MCRTLLCVLLFSVSAATQDSPTFTSRSELVLVPAVVTTHGQLIRGLSKKDFVLLHDGKPENIAVFEEVDQAAVVHQELPLSANTVQNYAPKTQGDVVILVLDLRNDALVNAKIHSYIRDMCKYFAQARTPVAVLLLTYSGLQQIHSFSSSPDDLTRVVDSWISKNPPPAALPEATRAQNFADFDRIRLQPKSLLDPITTLAQAYRGIAGRKKLIWVSTNFMEAPSFNSMLSAIVVLRSFQMAEHSEQAWKAMSDANVAVYPIDMNGVKNPVWDSREVWPTTEGQPATNFSGSFAGPRFNSLFSYVLDEPQSDQSSMLRVAQKTGGQNCTDLPDRCIKRIDDDAKHYYLLGFYLAPEAHPGWHQLKVKGAEQKYSIRTRNGFMVIPPSADKVISLKVLAHDESKRQSAQPSIHRIDTASVALASPVDYTSVPLRLQWSKKTRQGENTQIELALSSPVGGVLLEPESKKLDLDMLASIRAINRKGGEVVPEHIRLKLSPQQQEKFATSGFSYHRSMIFAPGRYVLRVLVRDNLSQKIGTVSTVLDLSPDPGSK
ncbi:MAG: hypothetical protein JWO13_107 [Acidobacteriales bacterium]|nr:hypothetical protein [Terriglobales bacterium]